MRARLKSARFSPLSVPFALSPAMRGVFLILSAIAGSGTE
jgi:hypothetical protein